MPYLVLGQMFCEYVRHKLKSLLVLLPFRLFYPIHENLDCLSLVHGRRMQEGFRAHEPHEGTEVIDFWESFVS